ncbi:MAG TPA: GGDEF domain-containing protein [Xanthobacteraceae bacterium]|nr:GGDEF domain-containing protein [Xanthobacteraceae bacterium]
MAKLPSRAKKVSSASDGRRRATAPSGERRGPPEENRTTTEAHSDPVRLAAEIDLLRAELAVARTKVRELQATADTDPLLNIMNRRGFQRELKRSLAYVKRYGTQVALIYLDLDAFKPINDRHGHAAGDAMLKAVAATLRRQVRESDVVARLGGDEFAVLLWNADAVDAFTKARSLEVAIREGTISWNDFALSVGASAGSTPLDQADGPDDVLTRADQAMYTRKLERAAARTEPF